MEQNIRLIVVDSVAALVRREFGGTERLVERQDVLSRIASQLKFLSLSLSLWVCGCIQKLIAHANHRTLAESFDIHVLVTNHVQGGGAEIAPALGNTWFHAVNTRLVLSQTEGSAGDQRRLVTVAKSPVCPKLTCEVFLKLLFRYIYTCVCVLFVCLFE